MNIWIVAGGDLDLRWAKELLKNRDKEDKIIAADSGISYLESLGIIPDIFVGDMDSIDDKEREKLLDNSSFKVELHPVRKDETDMRLALLDSIGFNPNNIYILGATGGRLDHFFGNVYILAEALENGIRAYIINEQNRLRIINEGLYEFKREERYGKYISLLAFGGEAAVSLNDGFSYSSESEIILKKYDTIGISNEIVADKALLKVNRGSVLVIESMDGVRNGREIY